MRRLAWFTPLPPTRSGIAAYNADVLPRLAARLSTAEIDVFTDPAPASSSFSGWPASLRCHGAHDFVWKHGRSAYDLVVYQLGNAACHDFIWPHLARYPGLVVLHDGNLHLERSRALLTRGRLDDYRAEFRYNHPGAPERLPELVIATLGGSLYYFYPMLRWVLRTARLVAVHSDGLAAQLRDDHPGVEIEAIRLGMSVPGTASNAEAVRGRFGISPDALVFAAFGLVTPEKRISSCLRALARVAAEQPAARLLLAGGTAPYYDAMAEARALGIADRVHLTGYVSDEDLAGCLAAADVCLCLRWPTGGETSATWVQAIAAGRCTIVTDLAHTADVPSLDPRTWTARRTDAAAAPITVAVDVLDEEDGLVLAMSRLAADADLRREIGRAARAYWEANHTLDGAVDDYVRVIERALSRPVPRVRDLPGHLVADHTELARRIAEEMGIETDLFRLPGALESEPRPRRVVEEHLDGVE